MSEYLNETLKVIHNRKSVRGFTNQKVTKEQLLELVKAGMAAPSAMNCQPWEFIVIQDEKVLKGFSESLQFGKMLDYAAAAIVVCTNQEKASEKHYDYAIIDATLASENILLAAESMGLGGAWVAIHPKNIVVNFMKEELGIPESIIPLNIIPIGYPTGVDKPKNKYNPDAIHWEKW